MIQTLIVDDEALARDGIRLLLKNQPDITVIGEADDGEHAVDAIRRLRPDLVFLDIQMPGINGFEVLQRVAHIHLPAVIFVTAYDRYAVRAFDADAIDYLLKPISDDRFHQALRRARRNFAHDEPFEQMQQRLMQFLESRLSAERPDAAPARYPRWFSVRDGRRVRFVKVNEIDWIESASNYVELHGRGATHLLRMTLAELETKLNPHVFVRVHRTTIVNVERVREVVFGGRGHVSVQMQDGPSLRLSRRYRDSFCRLDESGMFKIKA